jgi:chromosome segregation ATPase
MSDPYEREAAKAAINTLQRELAEAKNKIERQGARIKYLEGATNHATGTPLTKALEQLDEMRIDRDEWKAVSEGRLLGSIDKVAQLERELTETREEISDMEIRHAASMLHTQSIVDDAIKLREQRDALAEACRNLMKIVGAPGTNEWQTIEECDNAYVAGKKALAAVKGGNNE